MRVITGTARGRVLKTLEGEDVRPTTDRVKEAIFSIIQFEIEGRQVLDMFAGSGQLGIEALSRGAAFAVFVDSSRSSLNTVKENIAATGFGSVSKTELGDSLAYLDRALEKFDITFLDPPYGTGLLQSALERVAPHMNAGGIIVCESPSTEFLPETVGDFTSKRYKYGKTAITVYRN